MPERRLTPSLPKKGVGKNTIGFYQIQTKSVGNWEGAVCALSPRRILLMHYPLQSERLRPNEIRSSSTAFYAKGRYGRVCLAPHKKSGDPRPAGKGCMSTA